MITLPAVLATISRPSKMGTPLAIIVPSVRVNRATATLRNSEPKTGDLRNSASVNRRGRAWKVGLVLASTTLMAFALARPQFGTRVETVKTQGRDILVALDVSNSMLAEDLAPNRGLLLVRKDSDFDCQVRNAGSVRNEVDDFRESRLRRSPEQRQ